MFRMSSDIGTGALLFGLLTAPASGQILQTGASAQTAHARVTLVAAVPDNSGGWAGLHFELEPGWHVYWQNPGDSGGPPTVRWELPVGIKPSSLLWPTPERIPVGPLVNYGYHTDVTLPVFFKYSQSLPSRAEPIRAEVRWLICKDVCVSERASLSLPVPMNKTAEAQPASALIQRARGRVPKKAPASWRAEATSHGRQFDIVLTTDRWPSAATFFPLDESQIDDAAPQSVKLDGHQLRFGLKHSDQMTSMPRVLRGIVQLDDAAFEIAAPVVTQK